MNLVANPTGPQAAFAHGNGLKALNLIGHSARSNYRFCEFATRLKIYCLTLDHWIKFKWLGPLGCYKFETYTNWTRSFYFTELHDSVGSTSNRKQEDLIPCRCLERGLSTPHPSDKYGVRVTCWKESEAASTEDLGLRKIPL